MEELLSSIWKLGKKITKWEIIDLENNETIIRLESTPPDCMGELIDVYREFNNYYSKFDLKGMVKPIFKYRKYGKYLSHYLAVMFQLMIERITDEKFPSETFLRFRKLVSPYVMIDKFKKGSRLFVLDCDEGYSPFPIIDDEFHFSPYVNFVGREKLDELWKVSFLFNEVPAFCGWELNCLSSAFMGHWEKPYYGNKHRSAIIVEPCLYAVIVICGEIMDDKKYREHNRETGMELKARALFNSINNEKYKIMIKHFNDTNSMEEYCYGKPFYKTERMLALKFNENMDLVSVEDLRTEVERTENLDYGFSFI